jgi:hypothetical protein
LKDLKIDLIVASQDPTDNVIAGYLGVDSLKFMEYLGSSNKAALNAEPI